MTVSCIISSRKKGARGWGEHRGRVQGSSTGEGCRVVAQVKGAGE